MNPPVLIRTVLYRGVATCLVCHEQVAVGPPIVCSDRVMAAYALGLSLQGGQAVRHFGICAGGTLAITIEEVSPESLRIPLRSVR